jgi:DME family drug/metabolite transporter
VSVTALVSAASAPFCADAVVAASRRQAFSAQWRIAFLCSCLGILLFGLGSHVTVLGLLLALASGAAYAAYTLAAAKLEQVHSAARMTGTTVALLGAGLILMPDAAPHLSTLLTPRGLAVATYLGLATTALAYSLFVLGLRHLMPGTALMLLYVQPVAALLIGALLLGEQLEWLELLGIAHIAAAALLHLRDGNSRFSQTNEFTNCNNTPQGKCYVKR